MSFSADDSISSKEFKPQPVGVTPGERGGAWYFDTYLDYYPTKGCSVSG
jgi:hypothetical protein